MVELFGSAVVGLCVALSIISTPPAIRVIRETREARKAEEEALASPIEWPLTWAEIVAMNDGIPPAPRTHRSDKNYRHSIHCYCGKFARKDPDIAGVIHCHTHGMVFMSLETGPVTVVPVQVSRVPVLA